MVEDFSSLSGPALLNEVIPFIPEWEGTVVLFTPDMQIIDEFAYTDDLQHVKFDRRDLERGEF